MTEAHLPKLIKNHDVSADHDHEMEREEVNVKGRHANEMQKVQKSERDREKE